MTKLKVEWVVPRIEDVETGAMSSGRVGATGTPAEALVAAIGDRMLDLSPQMERIADHMRSTTRARIRSRGEGGWPSSAEATIKRDRYEDTGRGRPGTRPRTGPLIMHGYLINSIERDWSRSNAVAISTAPHAHFGDSGTRQYSGGPRWQKKTLGPDGQVRTRRLSRGDSRKARFDSSVHEPARPFMYLSETVVNNGYIPMLLTFVAEGRVVGIGEANR